MFSRENVKIADKTACSLLTETSAMDTAVLPVWLHKQGKALAESSLLQFIVPQTLEVM